MEIVKEKKFYGFTSETADMYSGVVILENDVWLFVHENGSAVGSDGRRYVCVSEEVESKPIYADDTLQYICTSPEDYDKEPLEALPIPDTDLVTLGWTTEADRPVIV